MAAGNLTTAARLYPENSVSLPARGRDHADFLIARADRPNQSGRFLADAARFHVNALADSNVDAIEASPGGHPYPRLTLHELQEFREDSTFELAGGGAQGARTLGTYTVDLCNRNKLEQS